ncbi:unnamed protein product, partial [Ectocarpus sp. 8 AP-2014]
EGRRSNDVRPESNQIPASRCRNQRPTLSSDIYQSAHCSQSRRLLCQLDCCIAAVGLLHCGCRSRKTRRLTQPRPRGFANVNLRKIVHLAFSCARPPQPECAETPQSNKFESIGLSRPARGLDMIRNVLVMKSGLVLFSREFANTVQQPRLLGSLLTAMVEFSKVAAGMQVAYVELTGVGVTLVGNEATNTFCALFHDREDGATFGRLIASEVRTVY